MTPSRLERTAGNPVPRRGVAGGGITVAIVVGVVLVAGALVMIGLGGNGSGSDENGHFVVARGGFDITIPASGELVSNASIEIRNHLDSRARIIEIIDEGTFVSTGDILFRLNDEEVLVQIRDAEDALDSANNACDNAVSNLEIQEKTRDSNVAKAEVNIELARLTLLAWEEGEVVSKRQDLQLSLRTAEKDFSRLGEKYEASLRLYEDRYISKDELEQDEIAMIRAEAEFSQAKLAIEVYEKYTHLKERQEKESNLRQTRDELERVRDRHEATIRSVTSDVAASLRLVESRTERLEKHRLNLEACVAQAPADGLVVYATSLGRDRWDEQESLRAGSELYPNQLVIVLPDTSNMVAEVKVNEALSGLVEPGQTAIVVSDALPDQSIEGIVVSIGVLAESGGWRDPTRRDYTVRIDLRSTGDLALKPSMRCAAEILVGRVEDSLHVPIPAIQRRGGIILVHVEVSGGWAERPVVLGRVSEHYVVVESGLEEGEVVLLTEPTPGSVVTRIDPDPRPQNQSRAP